MKKYFLSQILLLALGSVFAWYNTINAFVRFYENEGTIFKIKDCVIPNPVTEACFYGAIGFVIALIWATIVANKTYKLKAQNYLWWFLSAGTIFAWFNVTKEFIAFYTPRSGPVFACSGLPITNPFLTPCFTGASIFLLTTILAGYIFYKLNNSVKIKSA